MSTTGPTMGLTLGCVDTEAVGSQTQEVIGVVNELAADVVGSRGQAAIGSSQFTNMDRMFMG